MQEQERLMNLYDYIRIIIKRRRIILAIVIISITTTAITTAFLPKVYRATVPLIVLPFNIYADFSPISLGIQKRTERTVRRDPIMLLLTHKELLKSDAVLERVKNRLTSSGKLEEAFFRHRLSNKLKVKDISKANILRLEVKDKNPKVAKDIVTAWAEEYVKYNGEFISKQAAGSGDVFSQQLEIVRQHLIREGYAQLLLKLKTAEDELAMLKEELKKCDKFISGSGTVPLISVEEKKDKTKEDKRRKLADFQLDKLKVDENRLVNPIYLDLEYRIADATMEVDASKSKVGHLKRLHGSFEGEPDGLQRILYNKENKESKKSGLDRRIEVYEEIYNNLSSKMEETRVAKAMELGEVKIASAALEPEYPAGPDKKYNITLAAIVSLVFGVSLAVFMENYELNKAGSQKSAMDKDT